MILPLTKLKSMVCLKVSLMLLANALVCCLPNADALHQPNILLIYLDDAGIGMLETEQGISSGVYTGSNPIKTPFVRELSKRGMYMDRFYSDSPVCGPARYALLNGMHMGSRKARVRSNGVKVIASGDEKLFPVKLQEANYSTALFGKWGYEHSRPSGSESGFDYFLGHFSHSDGWRFYAPHLHEDSIEQNETRRVEHYTPRNANLDISLGEEQTVCSLRDVCDYTPGIIHERAMKWMRTAAKDPPFFLMWAPNIPHSGCNGDMPIPTHAGPNVDYSDANGFSTAMKGMGSSMSNFFDVYMNTTVATLKELGAEEDTMLIITSDNGASVFYKDTKHGQLFNGPMHNRGPFSGFKRSPREGGVRVPTLVVWPSRVAEGSTSAHVAMGSDIAETLLEVAGVDKARPREGWEGTSFASAMQSDDGRQSNVRRHVYMELSATKKKKKQGWFSVFFGDDLRYKRVCAFRKRNRSAGPTERYGPKEANRVCGNIRNVVEDPGEKRNVDDPNGALNQQSLCAIFSRETPGEGESGIAKNADEQAALCATRSVSPTAPTEAPTVELFAECDVPLRTETFNGWLGMPIRSKRRWTSACTTRLRDPYQTKTRACWLMQPLEGEGFAGVDRRTGKRKGNAGRARQGRRLRPLSNFDCAFPLEKADREPEYGVVQIGTEAKVRREFRLADLMLVSARGDRAEALSAGCAQDEVSGQWESPGCYRRNVLVRQLVALSLNVRFDQCSRDAIDDSKGVLPCHCSQLCKHCDNALSQPLNTTRLVETNSPCDGWSVGKILAAGNCLAVDDRGLAENGTEILGSPCLDSNLHPVVPTGGARNKRVYRSLAACMASANLAFAKSAHKFKFWLKNGPSTNVRKDLGRLSCPHWDGTDRTDDI